MPAVDAGPSTGRHANDAGHLPFQRTGVRLPRARCVRYIPGEGRPGWGAPSLRMPALGGLKVDETSSTHVLSVLVDNEFGVLARVVGLFSARGYNIESLTVAEVDRERGMSRITVVTTGTPMTVEQIRSQIGRIVPVHKVVDLTLEGPYVARDLLLVKVQGRGEKRVEALRIADIFRARVVDSTNRSFIFELTGSAGKLDAFIDLMRPLGLAEVARTGAVALARGDTTS